MLVISLQLHPKAKNDFLLGLVDGGSSAFSGAWIGGKYPEGWLVGPELGQSFTFQNWGGMEPNNNGYAYINIGASYAGIDLGQWADDSGQGVPSGLDPVIGYFVEYEPIPEPTTLSLLVLGGLALMRRRTA